MRFQDGVRVSYIGEPDDGVAFEDVGTVMLAEATASHVQWKTGSRVNDITLVPNHWLVPVTKTAAVPSVLDDSLEEGGLFSPGQVTATLNAHGAIGLYSMLADDGHLATLQEIGVEEIMQGIMAKVRCDSSVREAVAYLDEEDGEKFVALIASKLMKQAADELTV